MSNMHTNGKKSSLRINGKISLVLLLAATLLLSGCTPSGYSNGAVKTITKEHKEDAKQWFAEHMPYAKMTSGAACKDSADLFQAIQGEYKTSNGSYRFVYDYVNDEMYTDEHNDEICLGLKSAAAKCYGLSEEYLEISLFEHSLELVSGNDAAAEDKPYGHTPYGEKGTYLSELFPYDADPDEVIDNLLYGETPVCKFSLLAYVEKIPAYDPELISAFSGLGYLSYRTPMSDFSYDGVCSATYYDSFAWIRHVCLTEAEEDFVVGYTFEEKLKVDEAGNVYCEKNDPADFSGEVTVTRENEKEFVVTVPKGADLVLFAPKGEYLDDTIRKTAGLDLEDALSSDYGAKSSFFPGYKMYDAKYLLPSSNLYCYSVGISGSNKEGIYYIRKK